MNSYPSGMVQDGHQESQAPLALLTEDGRPDAQRRKNNKACLGCQTNTRKRRCDRDWNKKDAKCSRCFESGIPCERGRNKPHKAAVDVAGTPSNIINDASHETDPIDAGNTSGHHDRGQGSEPSPVYALPLNTDISLGIWLAECHFPGIFDVQRFMQRSMLSRDVNSDEYCSLMLHRVFLLSASKSAAESRKLLSEALRAFSDEFEEPSIATIMATTLLSSLLSKAKPQLAGDLLNNAFAWLDSHTQRNLLQNVSLNKITKLLEKVHAIAEEEGFRLRAHRDYGDDQLSLTTSQARGQGAESIITHTPTQRGANINVPSEQFASSLPPRQTPSQPSLGYTTAATYPFPLPNMLPPGVIDGATMSFMPRHSASTDGMRCRFDTYPSASGPNNPLMPVTDLPLQTMDMGDQSLPDDQGFLW